MKNGWTRDTPSLKSRTNTMKLGQGCTILHHYQNDHRMSWVLWFHWGCLCLRWMWMWCTSSCICIAYIPTNFPSPPNQVQRRCLKMRLCCLARSRQHKAMSRETERNNLREITSELFQSNCYLGRQLYMKLHLCHVKSNFVTNKICLNKPNEKRKPSRVAVVMNQLLIVFFRYIYHICPCIVVCVPLIWWCT